MKIRIAFLFAVASFFFYGQLSAQELTKEEKKTWKQIAKAYKKDPAALKALTEDRDQCISELQQIQSRVTRLEAAQNQENNRMSQLEQENIRLSNQLLAAEETIQRLQMQQSTQPSPPPPPPSGGNFNQGVVFRVQVGAFSKGKIPDTFRSMPDMTVEDAGNLQKVMVGNYRNYDDAKARVQQLKNQGVQGPWIVPFKNGVRVTLEEAMRK